MNLYLTYSNPKDDTALASEFQFGDLGFSPYDMLLNYGGELDELAYEAEVIPLCEFTAEDPDPDDDEQWFTAAEGLKTVNALLASLPGSELPEQEDLIEELQRLRRELELLQSAGRCFVFGIG